ncbi:hypothetical protein [Streptomyces sp. NPDC057280]|uniref:hypothetical protein n=1 Tax=Streptomyces sp. NPDC057280 TaxID=3346081 RepID=UPI00363A793D
MTVDPITAAVRLAGELMLLPQADPALARRIDRCLETWDVDGDAFLAQTEGVVLAALLATRNEDCSPGTWCTAAAAVLRQQDDVPLFAAVPSSLPAPMPTRMVQLRLLSCCLTPRSSLRWIRLRSAAQEFLEAAAPPTGRRRPRPHRP